MLIKWLLAALAIVAGAASANAQAPTKMQIATGVDPSFSAYYIALEGGYFAKHGLDVSITTGPSGSAMIAFIIQNQVQSAFGAEQAGIQDFNLDPNVVVVADGAELVSWHGIVGRDMQTLSDIKGKRVGVAPGSGSEEFWLALVEAKHLNVADYNIVQLDAPEMVAALERKDIDAYAAWEPWLARGTHTVAGAKLIQTSEGMLGHRVYIYMNRDWIEANKDAAKEFVAALAEATDLIGTDPDKAAGYVSHFLKLDIALTKELMPKIRYGLQISQDSIGNLKRSEAQLKGLGKLKKQVDFGKFVYPDLLKSVRPDKVAFVLPESPS